MNKAKTLFVLATLVILGPLAINAADTKNGFQPLFNGKDLTGWKLRNPAGHNSWSVLPGGILKNTVEKDVHGTDLVTEKKFWNFTVRYEYMTPDGSNSGFYLRGRHEIQILGDYKEGKATLVSNGSLYNFKAPDKFATKPGGRMADRRGHHDRQPDHRDSQRRQDSRQRGVRPAHRRGD